MVLASFFICYSIDDCFNFKAFLFLATSWIVSFSFKPKAFDFFIKLEEDPRPIEDATEGFFEEFYFFDFLDNLINSTIGVLSFLFSSPYIPTIH